ncbi:MAG: periplasmic nitrate reductase, NapE protein [Rhodoblastus sp.]
MIVSDDASVQTPVSSVSKRAELVVFGIIVAVIWPVMAVAVVGGYGFLIWMSQLVFGPPGPPHQ